MAVGKQNNESIAARVERAIELSDEALGEVAQIATEGIRFGLEANSHVEAAERDMRAALRQLVLAERELRSQHRLRPRPDEQPEGITGVVP